MAFLLRLFAIIAIFTIHKAEWIEITQTPKTLLTNKTKTSNIRILKKNENFHSSENSTPSPKWVEYQRERFGQKQNLNSQKLIVTTENRLKNSVKIIVPANRVPQSQIIQTRTRLDVVNNRPTEEIIELPQLTTQTTTTKRDMSNSDVHEINEYSDDVNDDEFTQANPGHKPQIEEVGDSDLQIPSWQGFLKFLKSIQANWVKHSGFSIEDKIRILKKLRDNLMRKIEQQFAMIWTPSERLRRRRKRGILDESTINFPPEAALMSINFLTFAVFLIKLVLQIVHLIKSKHYNISGFGITTQPFGKTTLKT